MHILCKILCIGAPSVRCRQNFDTDGAVLTFWSFDTAPLATLINPKVHMGAAGGIWFQVCDSTSLSFTALLTGLLGLSLVIYRSTRSSVS